MALQDDDNLLVGRGTDNYKLSYGGLKTKLTEDGFGSGGGGGGDPVVTVEPTLTAAENYPPTTLTATQAQVINGTKVESHSNWYKDDVVIAGATGLTLEVTEAGTYKYEERWVGSNSVSVYPKAEVVINNPVIAKPVIIAPQNGAGIGGDVTFKPQTSAINDVSGGNIYNDGSKWEPSFNTVNMVYSNDNRTVTYTRSDGNNYAARRDDYAASNSLSNATGYVDLFYSNVTHSHTAAIIGFLTNDAGNNQSGGYLGANNKSVGYMIEYINGQDRCDVQLMYNGSSITQKQITGEGITSENTIWVTRMSFDFKAAELYYKRWCPETGSVW